MRRVMIGAGFRFFVLFGLLVLASATSAQTFVDPEVIEAAYAVDNFKSTPRQEALVFMHNKDLTLLVLQGKIPPEVYQRNQSFFEMVNKEITRTTQPLAGPAASDQGLRWPEGHASLEIDLFGSQSGVLRQPALDPEGEAKRLWDEARRKQDRGDYAGALTLYGDRLMLKPAPQTVERIRILEV